MDRREFLKIGAGAAGAGAILSQGPARQSQAAPASTCKPSTPAILSTYSAQDHRRRLENIARCQQTIRGCMRKHLVTDYLPGHCVYNLGEYPSVKPWDPDDWDEREAWGQAVVSR